MTRYIYVQLSTDDKSVINYFGECLDPNENPMIYPQDETVWPNQAVVPDSDQRYIAFFDAWPGMNMYYIPPERNVDS
jgi:hypothetical protein